MSKGEKEELLIICVPPFSFFRTHGQFYLASEVNVMIKEGRELRRKNREGEKEDLTVCISPFLFSTFKLLAKCLLGS